MSRGGSSSRILWSSSYDLKTLLTADSSLVAAVVAESPLVAMSGERMCCDCVSDGKRRL